MFDKELTIILKAVDKTKSVFSGASKNLSNMGKKTTAMGKNLSMKLTAPILLAGAGLMKLATDFDKMETSVHAIAKAGGATGKELKQLTDLSVEFGKKGIFGPTEVMTSMEDMVRDGMKPAEIAAGRLKGVYDMAAASGTTMGESQIILSDTMQGFGADVKETTKFVDALVGMTLETPATMSDLAESMKYVAPIAAGLGVSIEDVSGMMGVLAGSGMRGSMAGTALRQSFLNLSAPTSEAQELMKGLGIEVFDASGTLKSMPDVVGQVKDGLKGMSDQQKLSTIETVFGARATTAWLTLVEAGPDGLSKLTEAINVEGRAEAVAKDMSEGLAASWKGIKAQIQALAIQFKDVFEPIMKKIVEIIKKVVNWVSNLSDKQKKWIVIIALLIAALGPALIIIGTLATVIGAVASPIGIIILAIGALIAAFYLIYKKIKDLIPLLSVLWDKIKDIFSNAISSITARFQPLIDLINKVIGLAKGIGSSVGGAVSGAVGAVGSLVGLADGGIVNRPTLAMIGEAGPEAVIPLSKAGFGGGITVNINGGNFLSENVADELAKSIISKLKMQGRV